MAGHSHWAGIKHKKGANDAKRGKLFSKLAKLIISAARGGGGDPDANLKLKYAIERARASSMPLTNIDRAIARGTGEVEGERFEDLTYEGYGPSGVAVLLEVLTDNRNRTGAEVRKIFDSNGGKLDRPGCVSYLFDKKGLISVSRGDDVDDEKLFEVALEANADEIEEDERAFEITCAPEDFMELKNAVDSAGYESEVAEIGFLPQSRVQLDDESARKVLSLMEALEDHDDIQAVHANFEIPESILQELEQEA